MIILLRHGQTTSNLTHALDTALPGAYLTDLGCEQASGVAPELTGMTTTFASPARRAQQTAHHAGRTYEVLDGVQEINAGDLEMRADLPALERYHRAVHDWLIGTDTPIPGGETKESFLGRYLPAITSVEENTLIVSHGCAIRIFSALACGLDADKVMANPLNNCEWVGLERTGAFGSWRLINRDMWM
ncbi:histidine phosphatase family protein [Corynebacterium glucuronolyticum]